MLFNITLKANEQRELNGTGQYFNLLSSSAGKIRIRALDSDAREIISTEILNGDAIEFERLVAKLYVTASEDAAAVLYFSQHKLVNSGVTVKTAGQMKASVKSFIGFKRVNTVTAQNKKVRIKADKNIKVKGSLIDSGYSITQGTDFDIETSGDIYAGIPNPILLTPASFLFSSVATSVNNNDRLDGLCFFNGFFYGKTLNTFSTKIYQYSPVDFSKSELSALGRVNFGALYASSSNLYLLSLLNAQGGAGFSIIAIDKEGAASAKHSVDVSNYIAPTAENFILSDDGLLGAYICTTGASQVYLFICDIESGGTVILNLTELHSVSTSAASRHILDFAQGHIILTTGNELYKVSKSGIELLSVHNYKTLKSQDPVIGTDIVNGKVYLNNAASLSTGRVSSDLKEWSTTAFQLVGRVKAINDAVISVGFGVGAKLIIDGAEKSDPIDAAAPKGIAFSESAGKVVIHVASTRNDNGNHDIRKSEVFLKSGTSIEPVTVEILELF